MPLGDLRCIWKSEHVPWQPKIGSPEVQSFHSLIFLMVKKKGTQFENIVPMAEWFSKFVNEELVEAII